MRGSSLFTATRLCLSLGLAALGATACGGKTSAGSDAGPPPGDAASQSDRAGADGGLADATTGDGGVISCGAPADMKVLPTNLAETGCMDPAHPTHFTTASVAYEVNSPLWSDAADKERAFVLPAGGKIHVLDCAKEPDNCTGPADDGKWIFPIGTVMLKNFLFDGKVVETRLLAAMPDRSWFGYNYQWDEAQAKATLVPDRLSVTFKTGSRTVNWQYPKQDDCIQCHTRAAGWTLGPETAQMNRVPIVAAVATKSATENQIAKMAAAGLFDAAPATPYKAALVTPYAGTLGSPTASATVTDKARSYLHANCSFCHRPDADFKSLDLRYDTPFKDTQLCNATPFKGIQNVADATNLSPGKPDHSVIWLRMNTLGDGRMPSLASALRDDDGVNLVSDWIKSIKDCP